MLTIDYLNNDIKALTLHHTIADAKELFAELIFTHIPIVEKGVFYGLIAESDLFGYEDLDKTIEEICYGLQVFFTLDDVVWLDLLKMFSLNEANIIPVLNSKNEYLGYFELSDILHYFSNTPFLQELGNILIVSKNEVDFSISEIAQIVESNDSKLYGVIVSGKDGENVVITVKLYSDNINDVIHTFRRYDYHIILGVNEDEYINDLKQRSDYLQKYLNI
jgi:CBS domain-containing protein